MLSNLESEALATAGWIVHCESPLEIAKEVNGDLVGFASGEAARIVIDHLNPYSNI